MNASANVTNLCVASSTKGFTMPANKRPRSDSAAAAVNAMLNAAKPLPAVPKHVKLRKQDMPFWEGIVCARARAEWTECDLVVGAQLARCQADMEAAQQQLDEEGTTIENHRGTMVANPLFSVLQQLAQREMALMRVLRMGTPIPTVDLVGQRGAERAARTARTEAEEEDLLA